MELWLFKEEYGSIFVFLAGADWVSFWVVVVGLQLGDAMVGMSDVTQGKWWEMVGDP